MAVESDADRASLFDADEFGVAATVTIGAADPVTVNGVFENEFVGVETGAGVPVEMTRPVFTCAASDVTGIAHGDTVVIDTTSRTVRGIEPDGTGVVRLILKE